MSADWRIMKKLMLLLVLFGVIGGVVSVVHAEAGDNIVWGT
jgi:hypothetical protein